MITLKHTTVGSTPLDERSARRTNLYLTTHNTHNRNIHASGGIRTHNLSRRAAAVPRFRPRGHWDRHIMNLLYHFLCTYCAVSIDENAAVIDDLEKQVTLKTFSNFLHLRTDPQMNTFQRSAVKGKAIPLQAWTEREGSRKVRL